MEGREQAGTVRWAEMLLDKGTHLYIVAQLLAIFLSSYEHASIVAMINPAAKVDRARKTKGRNSSKLVV